MNNNNDDNDSDNSDDEVEEVTTPDNEVITIVDNPATVDSGGELASIFDDDMITKFYDEDNKMRWKCGWCNNTFAGWNATKAIAHVNKVLKADIKPCQVKIDKVHARLYANIYRKGNLKRAGALKTSQHIDRSINNHNDNAALMLDGKRSKSSSNPSSSTKRARLSLGGNETTNLVSFSNSCSSNNPSELTGGSLTVATAGGGTKLYVQRLIHDGPNPTADSKLTMAIADMIHGCGFAFSLVSDPKFRKVIQLAKTVGSNYQLPSRNTIAGELLDLNYDTYTKKTYDLLLKELDIFGISFFGDGATVKKMPLLNILASSAHHLVAVLEIVDCSLHVQEGGKKDARYIASLFRPHIDKVEASCPNSCDVIYFDGASNVQKAGKILEVSYPRTVVLQGAEHVVSLFFNDMFKLPEFTFFNKVARRCYRVFGNGAMHAPYAIFQKYSKNHNDGISIGLIRAAGTRMAGTIIVLLRLMRLKPALISAITSPEFVKLKIVPSLCKLIQSDKMWDDMECLVKSVYPALVVLRLADQKQPAMDRLYFYVRRLEETVKRSKPRLDAMNKNYITLPGKDTTFSMMKYFLSSDKETVDCFNEFRTKTDFSNDSDDDSISSDGTTSECISDDESNKSINSFLEPTFSDKILLFFDNRKKKLVHDLSISGWMVSPKPEIMEDARINHLGEHRNAVEALLKKWYGHETNKNDIDEVGNMINLFWEEHDQFHNKTGIFSGRPHIWNSEDIRNGNSHFWHKKNSYRYTKVFGKFACRVCSKILGIGSAERCWGDVKHLKTDKRSHLSAERVKKQATIFGNSCIAKAEAAQMYRGPESINSKSNNNLSPFDFLNDQDYKDEYDLFKEDSRKNVGEKPKRIFKNWCEDWEAEARKKKCPVNEAKLLAKYGNLSWFDIDNKQMCTWSMELSWTRIRGDGGGYCVTALDEGYQSDDPDKDDHIKPWEITDDLRFCIATYYTENPQLGVQVQELE